MRRKLRFLSVLIALATMTNVAQSQGYDFASVTYAYSDDWLPANTLYYKILSDTTVEITTGPVKPRKGLIIPDNVLHNGVSYKVIGIGRQAFSGASELTSVYLGWNESLEYIEYGAFRNCGLYELYIPGNIKTIGQEAFAGCTNLTSVEIGDGVVSIGNSVFYQCNSLESVEIGNTVTDIGYLAFGVDYASYAHLKKVIIMSVVPPSLSLGGNWVFYNQSIDSLVVACSSLESYKNSSWNINNVVIVENGTPVLTIGNEGDGYASLVSKKNYCTNDTVVIEAIPNEGHTFGYWSDGCTDNPRTMILNNDTSLYAIFDIPHMFSFEDTISDALWTLTTTNNNTRWYIDTAAKSQGHRGLYISSDGGLTNTYDSSQAVLAKAYTDVYLDASVYEFTFDWRSEGAPCVDILNASILDPRTDTIVVNLGGADFCGNGTLYGANAWQTQAVWGDIKVSGTYRIQYTWETSGIIDWYNVGVPGAIDNIKIVKHDTVEISGRPNDYVMGSVANQIGRYNEMVTLTAIPNT